MNKEIARKLLITLCPMYPYGVKIDREWIAPLSGSPEHSTVDFDEFDIQILQTWCDDENAGMASCGEVGVLFVRGYTCKPYLRPMSSMTEEEVKEYNELCGCNVPYPGIVEEAVAKFMDWLNAHHFDYRGLIEKGLALEAPEGMYDLK